MTYTARVLPYQNRMISVQEIVNEWTVTVASYHLICFTEWVYDRDRRLEIGWSLIAVIALNVGFNIVLLLTFVVKSCKNEIKKRFLSKSSKKKLAISIKKAEFR